MSGVQTLEVPADDAEMRLDRWLHRLFPHVTQGQIQKFARTGQIRIDGKRVEAGARLVMGQKIRIPPLPDPASQPKHRPEVINKDAEALRQTVLYKDEWVIVIDKPAGLASQGGSKVDRHLDGMLDALAYGGERPRLVHRLDKETSGVLILARTRKAAQKLTECFRDKRARKYYWAITIGVPKPHQGKIEAALAKLPDERTGHRRGERMGVDQEGGRQAATLYQVVDHAVKAAWVALWPLTGRTHQLRAHMELIGTPILGDEKYDVRATETSLTGLPQRLHLHARRLILPHPSGQGIIDVTAPLPRELKATWQYFGFGYDDGDPFAGQG